MQPAAVVTQCSEVLRGWGGGEGEVGMWAPALVCSLLQKQQQKKRLLLMSCHKLFILNFIFVVCTDVSI